MATQILFASRGIISAKSLTDLGVGMCNSVPARLLYPGQHGGCVLHFMHRLKHFKSKGNTTMILLTVNGRKKLYHYTVCAIGVKCACLVANITYIASSQYIGWKDGPCPEGLAI